MRLGPETVELRDKVGPYAGQVRRYLKHAAEHAVSHGFAEYLTPESTTEPELSFPTEIPADETPPMGTPLPEDFPGRQMLVDAGLETLEAVAGHGDLLSISGVGKATRRRIARYLDELPGPTTTTAPAD